MTRFLYIYHFVLHSPSKTTTTYTLIYTLYWSFSPTYFRVPEVVFISCYNIIILILKYFFRD
jgi:hypothetical protein